MSWKWSLNSSRSRSAYCGGSPCCFTSCSRLCSSQGRLPFIGSSSQDVGNRPDNVLPASNGLRKLFAAPVRDPINDPTAAAHDLASGGQQVIRFQAMEDGIDAPLPKLESLMSAR